MGIIATIRWSNAEKSLRKKIRESKGQLGLITFELLPLLDRITAGERSDELLKEIRRSTRS